MLFANGLRLVSRQLYEQGRLQVGAFIICIVFKEVLIRPSLKWWTYHDQPL